MSALIKNISELPTIEVLKHRSQAFALLDAIFSPEWQYRYFSYDANWSSETTMASMRDGSGEEYFFLFSKEGVVGKVRGEVLLSNASEVIAGVPECFSAFKNEVAFSLGEATFFCWREGKNGIWSFLPSSTKTFPLLDFLAGGLNCYADFASEYYEIEIDKSTLSDVFNSRKVSVDQLAILNPRLEMSQLLEDLAEIGIE